MKPLYESLFDKDLIHKKEIVYLDPDEEQQLIISVDSYLWKECQSRFDDILETLKRSLGSDNYLKKNGKDKLIQDIYIIYMDKDCIVCTTDKVDDYKQANLSIISPETIYANIICDPDAKNIKHCFPSDFLNKTLKTSFEYYPKGIGWNNICSLSKEYGEILGRIPETISDKAKDVIKKYIRPRHLKYENTIRVNF